MNESCIVGKWKENRLYCDVSESGTLIFIKLGVWPFGKKRSSRLTTTSMIMSINCHRPRTPLTQKSRHWMDQSTNPGALSHLIATSSVGLISANANIRSIVREIERDLSILRNKKSLIRVADRWVSELQANRTSVAYERGCILSTGDQKSRETYASRHPHYSSLSTLCPPEALLETQENLLAGTPPNPTDGGLKLLHTIMKVSSSFSKI